ncbi:MAG TPA: serine hydrolase [Pseudoxanthomonas sp.]|nr:serine hydrolase [Pseudoxanthomonas sp.]
MNHGAWRAARGTAFAIALVGCFASTALADEKNAELDTIVDQAFARYRLPGLAVGVIEDGKIVYIGTRGELAAGSGQAVTSKTLFKIASNSKAMTASVLARLVDAGKLRWEDPVIKYLPSFRMYDPWVTRNMQVKDLLVHNSGLPEGGGDLMLWPEPNRFTRADIIAGLAHIKPAYSFRSGYAYDNLLYVVAGEVAAAAGGAPYEELVRREVFQPLGLSRCRVGAWRSDQVGDVAQPHARVGDRNVAANAGDAMVEPLVSAAAGGIRCSLDDMLAWANNWLAPDAKQQAWLSAEQRQAAWVPRTPMPISARRRAWDGTRLFAYGYGWRIADVDGVYTVSHTGTLSGMYSIMTLLPDRRSGFVVLINGEADAARTVLNEVLLKRFTKPADDRGVAYYADELQRESESKQSATKQPDTGREAPTLKQFGQWFGVYRDPWFGEARICPEGGQARFASDKSPMLSGRIMRSGSRYVVDWDHDSVDAEAWLDFHPETSSQPARLTMAKVDPEADFSYDYEDLAFERIRGCE